MDIQYFLYFGKNKRVLGLTWVSRLQMVSMTRGMLGRFCYRLLATLLACAAPFEPILVSADQVPVRHMEGLMHGFLVLRSLDGKRIADGEMTQVADGVNTKHETVRYVVKVKIGGIAGVVAPLL